jgi:hypothetical protein
VDSLFAAVATALTARRAAARSSICANMARADSAVAMDSFLDWWLVHRAVRREGNHWPFRLRRASAAVVDRFFRCWKRHTEVGRLSVIAEADFRDGASRIADHCPAPCGQAARKRPSGCSTLEKLSEHGASRQLTFATGFALTQPCPVARVCVGLVWCGTNAMAARASRRTFRLDDQLESKANNT